MWLKTEGFHEKVKLWWESYQFVGSPSYILFRKLLALKEDLRKWNKEEFRNVGEKNKLVMEGLQEFVKKGESEVPSTDERIQRVELKSKFKNITHLEEINWHQKSQALRLKERDNNTSFFHRLANSHRSYNNIDKLEVEVEVIQHTKEQALKESIVGFYNFYCESESWRPHVENLPLLSINKTDVVWLKREFSKEEILASLPGCLTGYRWRQSTFFIVSL